MDQSGSAVKNHVEKLEKFKGSDFKHWQQKMLFYLTTLHVADVLTTEAPKALPEGDGENVPTDVQRAENQKAIVAWASNEFLCRNYILNALDDSLYDIYSSFKTKKPLAPQKTKAFKKPQTGGCWVCGKPGHRAKECYFKKDQGGGGSGNSNNQANLAETENQFIGVVYAANLVTNSTDWWIDTGASMHVCSAREIFTSYQPIKEGEPLFMGNATTTKVEGKGKVILKFTSGKELVLTNVLHVPEICKNLVFGPVLSNKGFKLVFESDKFVLTKGGVYVGKGYLSEGLFKLNVVPTMVAVINNNNAGTSAASMYMVTLTNL
ncbi:uncharacterized protein LOC112199430 [Rosa chinensis]|uniref:uncharacterized protein LOC112199430 n=1 Tax=Rosa chinensis TaxID=74649 RepID=UPI000D0889E5|nr:uncharacterized protein LOC112199430 [Rosa chinensis]